MSPAEAVENEIISEYFNKNTYKYCSKKDDKVTFGPEYKNLSKLMVDFFFCSI